MEIKLNPNGRYRINYNKDQEKLSFLLAGPSKDSIAGITRQAIFENLIPIISGARKLGRFNYKLSKKKDYLFAQDNTISLTVEYDEPTQLVMVYMNIPDDIKELLPESSAFQSRIDIGNIPADNGFDKEILAYLSEKQDRFLQFDAIFTKEWSGSYTLALVSLHLPYEDFLSYTPKTKATKRIVPVSNSQTIEVDSSAIKIEKWEDLERYIYSTVAGNILALALFSGG